jgi:hypothetical protein
MWNDRFGIGRFGKIYQLASTMPLGGCVGHDQGIDSSKYFNREAKMVIPFKAYR